MSFNIKKTKIAFKNVFSRTSLQNTIKLWSLPKYLGIFLFIIILLVTNFQLNRYKNTINQVDSSKNDVSPTPDYTENNTNNSEIAPSTQLTPTINSNSTKSLSPTPTTQQNTNQASTTQSDSSRNTTNSTSSQPNHSAPTNTIIPTAQPNNISTLTPTTIQESPNIQIWVRAWSYSNNGNQSAASGNVKILKDGQQITSGSTDANEVYKVSNMPTNSNLSIYFYLQNGCGQVKQLTTSSNTALYQVDFNFSASTNCI